ncbi:MAG: TorF family putative porin, partial [Chloroflexota bacterium]
GIASAASISANATLQSDYTWRGMTQNNGDASINGGLDVEFDSGFYVGTWVAAVGSGAEVDYYGGLAGEMGDFPVRLSVSILAGIWSAYFSLALFFNTTRLFVEDDRLRVISLPFPTHLPRRIPVSKVSKVELKTSGTNILGVSLIDLDIQMENGRWRTLMGNLANRKDGEFLKQELEFILGLDHDENVEQKAKV